MAGGFLADDQVDRFRRAEAELVEVLRPSIGHLRLDAVAAEVVETAEGEVHCGCGAVDAQRLLERAPRGSGGAAVECVHTGVVAPGPDDRVGTGGDAADERRLIALVARHGADEYRNPAFPVSREDVADIRTEL